MKRLNLLQTFNAMRIFLELEYDKTQFDDIATMLTALILCKNQPDWQSNPQVDLMKFNPTFDEAGWIDWMHSVQEVLKKNNILDDAYHVTFTTELAFEFMVAYVAYFHVRFSGYDETGLIELSQIGVLLNQVYKVKQQDTDPIWQLWLQAVDHAINDSYPLDAFC